MSKDWSDRTTWDTVCRRHAGWLRYNRGRQFLRNVRRAEIFFRLVSKEALQDPSKSYGIGAALARELGVSRSTVCRDMKVLRDPAHRMPKLGEWPAHLNNGEGRPEKRATAPKPCEGSEGSDGAAAAPPIAASVTVQPESPAAGSAEWVVLRARELGIVLRFAVNANGDVLGVYRQGGGPEPDAEFLKAFLANQEELRRLVKPIRR